ncbi:carboxymuconolactone decarboxylase family protein [Aquibium sp. A9E412]|uniref:carboxymuconolactone decarboxylase family protein n=1 Tax=Aquibium sp. A9E412 TaxID=2976767 RepID=UPI0025B1D71D|nr:carboxymuconolactone decarboxylase family protein [Aquibium sp. A9E412]MDN2565612.1 carboxymuconolactone decarboxylase family protein [Aquibium sp. A9E412]
MQYELFAPEGAPGDAGERLAAVREKMGGLLPNLYRQMAGAPIVLEAYLTLSDILSRSSFSPAEQQLILLTASARNGCRYCVAAHSSGGRMAKLDKQAIAAVRDGAPADDARLEALRRFTERVLEVRGKVGKADLDAFTGAGFTREQAAELLVGVAMKSLSNYFSRLADTPVDDFLARVEWAGNEHV